MVPVKCDPPDSHLEYPGERSPAGLGASAAAAAGFLNPTRSDRDVHRVGTLAIAAALGVTAGSLLGAYWASGGTVILSAALVAMMLTAGAPLLLWRHEDRVDRRRAHESAQRERRDRYEGHAEQLNDQAVRPLRTLHLELPTTSGETSPAGHIGLAVNLGDEARPVEELPNWSYAVEHFLADPELGPSWAATESAVRRYYALRDGAVESLAGRYTHLLLSRYGFETPLEGGRFDPPPWYDARAFVGVALAIRGRLDRSTITVVPALVEDASDDDARAPHLVLVGETPVACAPTRDAANPGEIADLVELGRSGPATVSSLRALTRAETDAKEAVRRMAEASRHYSDRMVIEHAGTGVCAICRPWIEAMGPEDGGPLR